MSWIALVYSRPLIGGSLANAATQYPKLFTWHVFVEHPYLLPCVVCAVLAIIGAGLGYIFIKEVWVLKAPQNVVGASPTAYHRYPQTLPSKRKDANPSSSAPRLHGDADSDEAEPAGVMALLAIPAIRALTISGFAMSFLSLAFDVVFTLFCYTPIDAGGLGLEVSAETRL